MIKALRDSKDLVSNFMNLFIMILHVDSIQTSMFAKIHTDLSHLLQRAQAISVRQQCKVQLEKRETWPKLNEHNFAKVMFISFPIFFTLQQTMAKL